MTTLVFDAEPVLGFLLGEPLAPRVAPLLQAIADGRDAGRISRVNLAEVAYGLHRRSPQRTVRGLLANLEHNGLEPLPCEPAWALASRIKARHAAISLPDAFAAATAKALDAPLVLGRDAALRAACKAEGVAVRAVA